MKDETIEDLLRELKIHITNNVGATKSGLYEKAVERRRAVETIESEIIRRVKHAEQD